MEIAEKTIHQIQKAQQIFKNEGLIELIYEIIRFTSRKAQGAYDTALLHFLCRYYRYRSSDGQTHVINCDGYRLGIDLDDQGLSHDLLLDGVREPISSRAYRYGLRRINENDRVSSPIRVLEIGANIGYYALMPIAECNDTDVYAVEADPNNVAMLRENIRRNNATDSYTVDHVAFGDINDQMEFYTSSHSNRGTFHKNAVERKSHLFDGKMTVPVRRGDEWLSEHGVSISDIDVLRMDVEGYEGKVLNGLPDILDHVSLVHMEVHTDAMEDKEAEAVVERLENSGLEIIVGARGEKQFDVTEAEDILNHRWIEMVAWRN